MGKFPPDDDDDEEEEEEMRRQAHLDEYPSAPSQGITLKHGSCKIGTIFFFFSLYQLPAADAPGNDVISRFILYAFQTQRRPENIRFISYGQ